MPLVSFKIVPAGVGTSISMYVATVAKLLKSKGYKPIVTPDTTVIRVDRLWEVGELLELIHEKLSSMGVQRLVTLVLIDDRRDVPEREPEDLVRRVKQRFKEMRG